MEHAKETGVIAQHDVDRVSQKLAEAGFDPDRLIEHRKRHKKAPEPAMKIFSSGAKSTVKKPLYYLIPLIALQLLAERFGYGASRHGARNYRKGKGDEEFINDRLDHLIEHLFQYTEHRRRSDLAAVLCNAAILADIGAFVEDEQA